jgi:predicted transcriptional regulator
MTKEKEQLIPTSIRIDSESLRQLTEAAALKHTTRTELLRQAITEILNRWKIERKAIIQELTEA